MKKPGRPKVINKMVRKTIPLNESEYEKALLIYPGKLPGMIRDFIREIIKPAN